MNKIFTTLSSVALFFVAITTLGACSADEPSELSSEGKYTYNLDINIERPSYEKGTRAGWMRGDIIYLTFKDDTPGKAEYNGSSWNVSTDVPLSGSGSLSAVYIENPQSASTNIINLDYRSAVYTTSKGNYRINGSTVSATATLAPLTGRIRFAGKDGDVIKVYGISCPTSYSPKQNSFINKIDYVELTVSNGYTPYIYGLPANEDAPLINVINGDYAFTRSLADKLVPGAGGYFTLPTADSHFGWDDTFYFFLNGARFDFIPVNGLSDMFLMSQTEMTRTQAKALRISTYASSLPANPDSGTFTLWANTVISEAKTLTSLDFFIPTVTQWEYAYNEGKYHSNFLYSGSDNIDDVAWYDNNSSSLNSVATKQPNGLGFYDMTGNVSEVVYDDGGNFCLIGGNYGDSATKCLKENYLVTRNLFYSYVGIRPCIKP